MAFSYSEKHLGAGSIGGRGFWLCKEAIGNYMASNLYYGAGEGLHGNSNLKLIRSLDEALTYNEKLPFIANQSLLEFYHDAIGPNGFGWGTVYAPVPEALLWRDCGTFGGKTLFGRAPWGHMLSRYHEQRHAHRVLYDNRQGNFVESAVRIPLGQSGYTDTLPGLFVIEPVPGTIISGQYCFVTIKPLSNPRVWWTQEQTKVFWDFMADFGTALHPYLRSASEMVRVDLTSGNHNRHVIPGVDIQFNTPLEGDKGIVSIGYEYINAYSETGELGDIIGAKDYFMPLAARGLQPWQYQDGGWRRGEFFYPPSYLGWFGGGGGSSTWVIPSRWHIYNVTGQEQTGCKFSVRPLVRMDQGNKLTPFDQWFMGPNVTADLTPQSEPYSVSFTNYQVGSPPTVTIVFSGASTYIVEIHPTTFQPTGVIHSDGSGLKCDGTTLYRWDALGIYFVLSADLVANERATVCVRKGSHIENYTKMTNTPQDWPYFQYEAPPYSMTIGGWDAIYDSDSGLYYPSCYGMPESTRSGVMQTQGYDYQYENVSIDAINSHWYNHQFCVATWLTVPQGQDLAENMNEYAVTVTCDDPRYFQVVPCTWNFTWRRQNGQAYVLPDLSSYKSRLSANTSVKDPICSLKCSGKVHERQGGLVLRVNQLSSELIDLMADSGITLE